MPLLKKALSKMWGNWWARNALWVLVGLLIIWGVSKLSQVGVHQEVVHTSGHSITADQPATDHPKGYHIPGWTLALIGLFLLRGGRSEDGVTTVSYGTPATPDSAASAATPEKSLTFGDALLFWLPTKKEEQGERIANIVIVGVVATTLVFLIAKSLKLDWSYAWLITEQGLSLAVCVTLLIMTKREYFSWLSWAAIVSMVLWFTGFWPIIEPVVLKQLPSGSNTIFVYWGTIALVAILSWLAVKPKSLTLTRESAPRESRVTVQAGSGIVGTVLTIALLILGYVWLWPKIATSVAYNRPVVASSRAATPTAEWEMIGYEADGEQGWQHQATLIRQSASELEFEYLSSKGAGKLQLTSPDGKTWTGTWKNPGGHRGLATLQKESDDYLTGQWTEPDGLPKYQKGGKLKLAKN